MTPRSLSMPLFWKTLLVGGIFGYLLAVITLTINGSSTSSLKSPPWRFLEEEETSSIVEEGEGRAEGKHHEEELDVTTMATTITLIILLLIFLTIAFETAKEHIEESADRNMKPIIGSLFGEMTVLGFLSIFTFCVTQLGYFTQLSIHMFGEGEEEALLELFEAVHYMLFFIMVSFVASVLKLVSGAEQMEKNWLTMNAACCDVEYMTKLDDAMEGDQPSNKLGWISHLCQALFPCSKGSVQTFRSNLRLFRGIRHEFVLERHLVPPFAPHATNGVEEDFDVGRYLSICLGHTLGHAVHLNHATWLFLAFLTVNFFGVGIAISDQIAVFAWLWAGTGWLFFLGGNYFDYHIWSILQNMAAPITSEGGATEIGALLSSSLPAWTRIDLDEYKNNRPWLARCFGSHGAISRQDSLYWMERKGPKLYLILFQIQLIFTSAYISLLLLSFLPHMYQESSTMGYSRLALYVVVSLLPIYLALSKHQTAAANMTMASSIGVHRRPRAVAQVIREEKTDRIICAMVTMQKLQHAARTGFASSSSPPQDTTPTDHSRPHTVALNKVAKTFDALDSSGDGTIGNQELKQVLSALGAPATDESLQAMIRLLDHNQDGHISKDEFLAFYSANIILEVDHHGLHELAREMFQQFDQDNSGEITLGEFKEVLEAFNVGFTVDEIGDLVNELDEEDDGTIGEHEFFKLLEKHRYLFKKHSLPPLE